MLGGNQFRLRQGFRPDENACTAHKRRPTVWGPNPYWHPYCFDEIARSKRYIACSDFLLLRACSFRTLLSGVPGLEESGEKSRFLTALFHSDIVTREN